MHDFKGTGPSRHGRKLSKLGPGIIDSKRLADLLRPHEPTQEELDDVFRPEDPPEEKRDGA